MAAPRGLRVDMEGLRIPLAREADDVGLAQRHALALEPVAYLHLVEEEVGARRVGPGPHLMAPAIAFPTSTVLAVPPRSRVRGPPLARMSSIARITDCAASPQPASAASAPTARTVSTRRPRGRAVGAVDGLKWAASVAEIIGSLSHTAVAGTMQPPACATGIVRRMKEILDAIEAGAAADEIARIPVPSSYRAAYVRRSDQDMWRGVDSRDKDPRRSLHVGEVPTPELAPDEAYVAVMASSINFNTVWSSIFE
ncbi:MAG: hypothetical protein ACO3EK_02380, partial [Alphaproteobacteria bacterium]